MFLSFYRLTNKSDFAIINCINSKGAVGNLPAAPFFIFLSGKDEKNVERYSGSVRKHGL